MNIHTTFDHILYFNNYFCIKREAFDMKYRTEHLKHGESG